MLAQLLVSEDMEFFNVQSMEFGIGREEVLGKHCQTVCLEFSG